MIVDCTLYRHGRRDRDSADLGELVAAARADDDAFVWTSVVEPTLADLEGLAQELGLHPLALEDALKARQRPKLEVYGDVVFFVLRTIVYERDTKDIESGELMVFLSQHFVVTVCHGRTAGQMQTLRRRFDSDVGHRGLGPAAVLHAICDAVVDHYLEVADQVEADVAQIEAQVFGTRRFTDTPRVYRLKRELGEFRRAVDPLEPALAQLVDEAAPPAVPVELGPFFRDVLDHERRVADALNGYDRQLADILQAHLAQLGLQQNADTRRISAWAAMALVPTLIAGIYGMNFDHMPELHWVLGYPMALALMVGINVMIYRLFKRSGWL